jgi:D-beta-D-heptose 7-phosphate kinase / D-beta-D-heptose 1-phosphate adenosyltransferase
MAVISRDAAAALARVCRARGQTVVLAAGVFDLLHPGHLRFLDRARASGDVLIVGVRADTRPDASDAANPAPERAEVMAALASVDAAVVVDASVEALVGHIQPDVVADMGQREDEGDVGRDSILAKVRGGPRTTDRP